MNGCEESDYKITRFTVGDHTMFAAERKGGDMLAICYNESSAIAVRDDAIWRARKLNGW